MGWDTTGDGVVDSIKPIAEVPPPSLEPTVTVPLRLATLPWVGRGARVLRREPAQGNDPIRPRWSVLSTVRVDLALDHPHRRRDAQAKRRRLATEQHPPLAGLCQYPCIGIPEAAPQAPQLGRLLWLAASHPAGFPDGIGAVCPVPAGTQLGPPGDAVAQRDTEQEGKPQRQHAPPTRAEEDARHGKPPRSLAGR